MVARTLRVLLVDDHEMVRTGLKAMLSGLVAVSVVGEASDAETAVRMVHTLEPDIVLCDVRLGADSGLDLCRVLLSDKPERRVVMLTVYDDEQYLYEALRAGAKGYLLKRINGEDLVRQLQLVFDGEIVIDPALAGRVAAAAARIEAGEFWPGARLGLTHRESEVLALIVSGLSNSAIAGRLIVGEETVKSHVRAVYRKLEVTDRAGAVARALREGLFR
jgi:DNA-binding NarL/FixJ family response regulator